ncbi:MAG: acylphosphatase [Elusimicrobia bacterium]|nr:acylphosphatase [Elusimicrobiota bacterium]
MEKSVKITVSGIVQGVGFRWFVERNARAIGLSGTVRNLFNGNVEIKAKGTEKQIKELIKTLYNGPGRVNDVFVEDIPNIDVKGFHITF